MDACHPAFSFFYSMYVLLYCTSVAITCGAVVTVLSLPASSVLVFFLCTLLRSFYVVGRGCSSAELLGFACGTSAYDVLSPLFALHRGHTEVLAAN